MNAPQNVLVVEDDVALSKLVGGLLDEAGYRPVTIADHTLIGAAVERWQPRLVILDGEIRDTGEGRSWDDAVAIRRAHPDIPVLMFSADSDDLAEARAGTSERSRAASFAGIVGKPFVVEEFLATVKNAVEPPVPAEQEVIGEAGDEAIKVFPDIGQHLVADWPATDLFATVVHELRAPLTVMRGQIQLARRYIGQDPTRERGAIDSALAQTDRMARLIADLLNQSRVSSNALSLNVVAFDLAGAVAAAMTRHQYSETARITFERPRGAVAVRGDPKRIAEILDNLLDNAIKYSAENAPIEISLTVHGAEAHVRVADHGVGVPASERSMLFTPFYRTSRTTDVHGTGLGLHISQQLAKRHGGRLWLEASSEAGSVFALALPLRK
ncbi:MAG: ATP-binding protein [Chloroflexota bacterium]|nr:ATP-binding protein [Chloroflexota bacterium]